MSRIIKTDPARERNLLLRLILIGIKQLNTYTAVDNNTRDLVAFIAMSLDKVSLSIDGSVQAWEKRGYWIKADRFRLEWEWAEVFAEKLKVALTTEDWTGISVIIVQVAGKLAKVKLPARMPKEQPWHGAYQELLIKTTQHLN